MVGWKKSEHLNDEEVVQGLGKINLASFCSAKARAIDGAIDIVNELAEEYNNGWVEQLLEAKKNCGEDSDCSECPFGQIEDRCILAELQIKGGNSGWIPCSERLPEENIEVDVTIKEIDGSTYTQTSWLQEGQWVVKKTPLQPTVIAWKERPEPYKEGEK